jgi:mono/diheme cytochrome c family protein
MTMTTIGKIGLVLVLGVMGAAGLAALQVVRHGVSARDEPTALEVAMARRLRHLAIPRAARETKNPVASSPRVLGEGRSHFADHCASCHGNDGRGKTEMGQNLYPKVPDMTLPDTQDLRDGEIFAIIENGVRLTGMPAWGHGTAQDTDDTWKLVHFIRHLPKITPDEIAAMEKLNPRSLAEAEEDAATERFLEGK